MAAATTITPTQILYGLCLSLAALIGFFVADPLQVSSLAMLSLLLASLAWPLFARWHHPLLVGSLHSVFVLSFLPGAMPLWCVLALGGFLIAAFHRSLNPEVRLFPPGGVPWALLALGAVVAITALVRGGVGLRTFGSSSMGSKKYIFIVLAIMSYFVLVSRPVPRKWAQWYVALFCLSGLTSLFSNLVYVAGSKFYWLFNIIDSSSAEGQARADWGVSGQSVFRSVSTLIAASAVIGFLLARFGLRATLELKRPWRLLVLLVCLVEGSLGGFRGFLMGTGIFLAVLFFLEGLHRTRYLAAVVAVSLIGFGALSVFSDRLPLSVQRSVSFLPVRIDEQVRQDAQGSLDWRMQMWDLLVHDVPDYLVLGKGYGVDPGELYFSGFNASMGYGIQAEWAYISGEYHNGPLSVLIPFGLWGALAFGWFLVAGALRLRWFCRHGDPELLNINRGLSAMFLSKIILFLFIFGAFNAELVDFAALVGLAECLNSSSRESASGFDVLSDSRVQEEEQAA